MRRSETGNPDAAEQALRVAIERLYVLSLTPFAPPQGWTAEDCLCSLAQALDDLRPFLDLWRQNWSKPALQQLAELLDSVAGELLESHTALEGEWWNERQPQANQ